MTNHITIGRLKALRAVMNISQEALGDSLNVTEAVVANWENGRTALNKIDSKAKRTLKRWMKDHMV